MKVYGKCENCKNEINYRTAAHTRVEFAMREGETKKLNCKACGTSKELHVDKLYAKPSKMPLIIASLTVLTIITLTLYLLFFSQNNYIFVAFGLPLVIYIILKKQDQTRVSDFNRRKLKGRPHNIG